jgi:hypothetical protein
VNPTPMHPPPVNPSPGNAGRAVPLMRTVTGPLLLTALGVLLTIDYMGGVTFGRSWPVLLIVFGLCKLLEHAGPRNL